MKDVNIKWLQVTDWAQHDSSSVRVGLGVLDNESEPQQLIYEMTNAQGHAVKADNRDLYSAPPYHPTSYVHGALFLEENRTVSGKTALRIIGLTDQSVITR